MAAPFGCDFCWPDDASRAADVRASLQNSKALIESNHLDVTICVCPHCGQAFVSVYHEEMNFSGGDDSYRTTRMPIDGAERALLESQDEAPSVLSAVNSLDGGRRSLVRNGGGGDERPRWSTGVRIAA